MKNFITGLSLATAIGVAVLFYLHFSGSKAPATASGSTVNAAAGGFRIAYFESDSIQNNFEYFKEVRAALQVKDQANAKQLNELKNVFTNKYQELQRVGQNLSQAELATKQQLTSLHYQHFG
jgi:outer membrane protein